MKEFSFRACGKDTFSRAHRDRNCGHQSYTLDSGVSNELMPTKSELQAVHHCRIPYQDLERGSGAVTMPCQLELPSLEQWLPEFSAAEYLGLDSRTLRDLRAKHRQGVTPFREMGGEFYYCLPDLENWLAKNAQRKAAREGRKNLTSRGILTC